MNPYKIWQACRSLYGEDFFALSVGEESKKKKNPNKQ